MGVDPSAPTVPARPPGPELERGAALGRYVVIDRLGSGGMGIVYRVHDPELDRKIAVKLLRADGGPHADRATRLRREAQAMAKLSHPNVITIHDVGAHEDQAFIAMELIDGQTLRQWLAEKPRPWRDVVDVFVRAGRGLAAAHSAGVIHRDFKPDNVLVARDGRVVVMDFGLARGEGEPSPSPPGPSSPLVVTITRSGALLGTPAYMSPEQCRGDAADARSDQFAFCVSLHEALYALRPFEPASDENLSAGDAMALAIVNGRVRPEPDGSTVPAWVRRILLRGLTVAPGARYPTMDALLADLAHDPTVARRRWLVAAAGLLLLAGGAAAGVFAWPRAADRSQVCRGAERKLAGVWDEPRRADVRAAFAATGVDIAQPALARVESALDLYARDWVARHTDACEATELRREQPSDILILRMDCLDNRRRGLGTLASVMASADADVVRSSFRLAAQLEPLDECDDVPLLRRRRPPPADLATRREVDRLRDIVDHADALSQLGKWKHALILLSPAVAAAEVTGHLPTQILVRQLLAKLYGRHGNFELAARTYRETLALAERADDDVGRVRALNGLVSVLGTKLDRFDEAHEAARASEEVITQRGVDQRYLAKLLYNLIDLNDAEGKPSAGALPLSDRALDIIAKREGRESYNYGEYLQQRAGILEDMERFDEARAEYEKARAILERVGGPHMPNIGTIYDSLGRIRFKEGDFTGAMDLRVKAIEVYRFSYGLDHPATGFASLNLGNAYFMLERTQEALDSYQRALAIFRTAYPPGHLTIAHALVGTASSYLRLNRATEALPLLRQAHAIREKYGDVGRPPPRWEVQYYLAWAIWDTGGDKREARALAEKALAGVKAKGSKVQIDWVSDWLAKHRR